MINGINILIRRCLKISTISTIIITMVLQKSSDNLLLLLRWYSTYIHLIHTMLVNTILLLKHKLQKFFVHHQIY